MMLPIYENTAKGLSSLPIVTTERTSEENSEFVVYVSEEGDYVDYAYWFGGDRTNTSVCAVVSKNFYSFEELIPITSLEEGFSQESFLETYSYAFSGTIKWDLCSHLNFNGEDFPEDDDSYYHLCGGHNVLRFIKALALAFEIKAHVFGLEQSIDNIEMTPLKAGLSSLNVGDYHFKVKVFR